MRIRAACALLLAAALQAQGSAWIADHYAKREAMVPMRDGVHLYTAIYTPKDPGGPLPFLLQRTPYGAGPYGPGAFPEELGPDEILARAGFIFVDQDVRGRMRSEGEFREMTPHLDGAGVDESTDAYDTIQWLLDHVPGHNGRVGAWGVSYPGFYAASCLARPHPALAAVSPQAPIMDLFDGDDDHHNGAFFLSQAFWFQAAFGGQASGVAAFTPAHRDGYRFFLELGALPHAEERFFHGAFPAWTQEMAHGSRDGYWRARDLRPHLRADGSAMPAVLTVGGWFDAEDLFGTLQLDRRLGSRARNATLVMGPWAHGEWGEPEGQRLGDVDFGPDTRAWFRSKVEAPFFLHHLKGGPDPGLPRAWAFETGRNLWHTLEAWPPPGVRKTPVYFRAGGALAFDPPRERDGADRFTSDPAHPVPYTSRIELAVRPDFMTADQRFASRRPDVLTYRTPPLDKDLTLAGPLLARLRVATTGTDADWIVKLIDVHPDGPPPTGAEPPWDDWEPPVNLLAGYQQLVRAEVMRGKFRESLERPAPFEPGRPTPVEFNLNDVFHTFLKGHRIMIQVQSTWFPLVDRNPQVFEDIYRAKDEDFRAQEHTLFRSKEQPSCLMLPVLD